MRAGSHRAIAEILAGTEAATGAGQDQNTGAAGGQPRQREPYLAVHLRIETVELVRSIQGQTSDSIVDTEQNGVV